MKQKKGFVLREVCGEKVVVGGDRKFRQAHQYERYGSLALGEGC